jgi:pimeloyl-ACP methyl ester carboxylesterase
MTVGSDRSEPVELRPVARRAVFHVGGYERNDARRFFGRLERELGRFRACWSVSATLGPVSEDGPGAAAATLTYEDGFRRTETELTFLDYDDIVAAESARPLALRLDDYAAAFLDYVVSGTAFRFFRANWRFGLFFLYPALGFIVPLLFGYLAWHSLRALPVPGGEILAVVAGLAVAALPIWYLVRRMFLFQLKGLWVAGRDFARGRGDRFEQRLDLWLDVVERRLAAGRFEEVVFVGHSFGAALVLDLAARHAARVVAKGGAPDFDVLTVGSTAPMVLMHPVAGDLRDRLGFLAAQEGVRWVDVHALADPINFFRCDPLALAGLPNPRRQPFPVLLEVRIRDMVEAGFYGLMKRNIFRVHYQFVSANTRRYGYDYAMLCFGPVPMRAAIARAIQAQFFDPKSPRLT